MYHCKHDAPKSASLLSRLGSKTSDPSETRSDSSMEMSIFEDDCERGRLSASGIVKGV